MFCVRQYKDNAQLLIAAYIGLHSLYTTQWQHILFEMLRTHKMEMKMWAWLNLEMQQEN